MGEINHTAPTATAGDGGLTLTALHEANIARQAEWCSDQVPDLSFRGNELAGETGEACNVIKKLERERQGWRGSRATMADLAEELADVVICADLCAVTAGIDLSAAVTAKFNATSDKVGISVRLPLSQAPAVQAPAGEDEPDHDLWCMHVHGPDELFAAPDFWTALAWAAELNACVASRAVKQEWAKDDNWPRTQAVVARWPWSAEDHAECLTKELALRAAHEARRKAASPTPTDAQPKAASPVGEEALRERIAQTLYEHDNRGLRDCWAWDADGLEAEHPGTRERYERAARAILPLVASHPTTGEETVATSLKLPPFSEVLAAIQERKCHDPEHDARVLDYAAIEASGAETVATPRDGGVREALARFDHHPDPSCDFCVEVEVIEGLAYDERTAGGVDGAALTERIARAMTFRAGGDSIAVQAKHDLRKVEQDRAALSAPGRAGPGEYVQHVKSGGWYEVLTRDAQVQTSEPLADYAFVAVYRNVITGATWVRPVSEMDDGRFRPAPAHPSATPSPAQEPGTGDTGEIPGPVSESPAAEVNEDTPRCYMCGDIIGVEPFHTHPLEGDIHERCCSGEEAPTPATKAETDGPADREGGR